MIEIAGKPFDKSTFKPDEKFQKLILDKLISDNATHSYLNIGELKFELTYRQNLVASAAAMSEGDARFETFAGSQCNPKYWTLTSNGGFLLRKGVSPADAILDIYKNSGEYAYECATAKVIILYHALLSTIGKRLFDHAFQDLYLYSWHFDPDLVIDSTYTYHFIPGDIVYFDNPDFNPVTFWWRGENGLYMGDEKYFGHGIGIQSSDYIIEFLNGTRKPDSNIPAKLTDYVARPDFRQVSRLLHQFPLQNRKYLHTVIHHDTASISCNRYLQLLHHLYFEEAAD
ncbi:protein-glutamine gamma-glutamyltransferase [Sutcliffiella rhizosphaerae]|uniref:Protein-glutamine gamma-glutamyltransferase n=1 Tax=Sutcliffiella rhizosphaerae TaxID=2880967 RepID=A0ABM8YPX3_9BACI|nr:protein-glutamine gamma-glutamyltransferase [Sutcliffiella rhizosphaerae]CAG9621973.1 Protein-glutamine gamma-glutamyltransferase [Sutcliffiella rhizosphaerae]